MHDPAHGSPSTTHKTDDSHTRTTVNMPGCGPLPTSGPVLAPLPSNVECAARHVLQEPDLDGQVVAYVAHVHEALNVGSKTLWATLGVLKHSRAHCNHLCEDEWQELADRFDEDVKEDIEYLEEVL